MRRTLGGRWVARPEGTGSGSSGASLSGGGWREHRHLCNLGPLSPAGRNLGLHGSRSSKVESMSWGGATGGAWGDFFPEASASCSLSGCMKPGVQWP